MTGSGRRVVVLAGGTGGAKLAHGLQLVAASRDADGLTPLDLAVIGNTGDDLVVHGLAVSPDLDTLLYTLTGLANETTGWGVRDDTWASAAMLEQLGAATWFRLGDRDLALNLLRTERLAAGQRLTTVTGQLADALGMPATLLPMTDDMVRTELATSDGWLEFQEYFVHRHHADRVSEVRHVGVAQASPTPEVLQAIASAELVVLAPSNPFLSIGTILAVPGIEQALIAATAPVVGVSPIVGGTALRGPADELFRSLGGEPSAAGVAAHYQERHPGLLDALVLDVQDADLQDRVRATGIEPVVLATVMRDQADRRDLAEAILARWLP
jgi:LPPG:FO 2-phospho-L-lactate transferase